jgi:hypothetical protein
VADLKAKTCSKCGAEFPTDPGADADQRDAEAKEHAEAFHPAKK